VPAFVDAPAGTLTPDEASNLKSKRDAYVFHVDLAPTVLDLIGVWDDPRIGEYRRKMPGHSLLEAELTTQPIPMTNCAGVWSCAFENWGYMQQNRKLEARSWDRGWQCFDVRTDPEEQRPLDLELCADLVQLAERDFGRLPGRGVERAQ
jgi:arylsulfatase A-like enzyme